MSAMDSTFPCVTRLKEVIHYLGKSVEDVAAEVGVSVRTMYNYVNGNIVVPEGLRPKLAQLLKCKQEYLFPHPSRWPPKWEPHVPTDVTQASESPSREGERPHNGASFFERLEMFTGPVHVETRHLIGREVWLDRIMQMVRTSPPKKLIVLRGPIGIGKSSELNRLAEQLRHIDQDSINVVAPR